MTYGVRFQAVLLAIGLVACSDSTGDGAESDGADGGDDGGACPVGSEGCACTTGGGCDVGLECLSGLCVDRGAGDDGGTGTGDGGGTGTGDDGGTGTTDGTSGGVGTSSGDDGTTSDAGTATSSGTTGTGATDTATASCQAGDQYCDDDTVMECGDGGPDVVVTECDLVAQCVEGVGTATCECPGGYSDSFGDGSRCVDIDECINGPCNLNATCTNLAGSFECECNQGFDGDGVICTDIDECMDGLDDCDVNATCTNEPGTFDCACNPNYTGDGRTCTFDDCMLDDFEAGTWDPAWAAGEGSGGTFSTTYVHDGTYGVVGPQFRYRTDVSIGDVGDKISIWVQMGATTSYVYLGYGSAASGSMSLALNGAGDLIIEDNTGYSQYTHLIEKPVTVSVNTWYLLEVEFTGAASVVGRLYDTDGTTLIDSLTYDHGTLPGTGVGIRGYDGGSATGSRLDTLRACE